MALDKEDILALAAAIRAPDAHELLKREEHIAAQNAKREKLEKETKKTKTHAFYRATGHGYITGVGRIEAGQIIALPLPAPGTKPEDVMRPSHTWQVVEPDEDTTEAEPKPAAAKSAAGAMRVAEPKPAAAKPSKRAADEEA